MVHFEKKKEQDLIKRTPCPSIGVKKFCSGSVAASGTGNTAQIEGRNIRGTNTGSSSNLGAARTVKKTGSITK